MNSDTPPYRSKAEFWRTLASIMQLFVGLITLTILVVVHFL